jgi:branched-chain amino acid transport system permease protein
MVAGIVIATLTSGFVYALLASGMTLIFGVAHIVNLAHTAFYVVGAYFMWFFMRSLGWGGIESIVVTVAAVTALGLLTYQFLLNRVRQHPQAVLLITIALAMVFQEVLLTRFGSHLHIAPPLLVGNFKILGITVEYQRLLIIGVVIAVMAILWLFLSKTKLGIAIRATANDAEVANLMGISVSKTLLMTMGIGTALAAIAAALMAPLWVFYPYAWMAPLTMILAIVVLGGLGSLKGSIIGAFIIALVETLVVFLIPEYGYLRTVIALLAMIIVLSVRPGGLFGIVFEEEKL